MPRLTTIIFGQYHIIKHSVLSYWWEQKRIADNLSSQGQVFMTTNFLEVVQLNVRKLAVSSNFMFDLDVFKSLRKKILPQKQKKQYKKTFSLFAIVLPFNFLHKTTDMLIWRYSFLILSHCTQLGLCLLELLQCACLVTIEALKMSVWKSLRSPDIKFRGLFIS